MAVPKQCPKCLMTTTWIGCVMQRWVRPWHRPVENTFWDDHAEFAVNANGFVKFPRLCGPWTCHACCKNEEKKFAFHCARCHWPYFRDSDTDRHEFQQPAGDDEAHDKEFWCDECSWKYWRKLF
jgi:hypothetical protein